MKKIRYFFFFGLLFFSGCKFVFAEEIRIYEVPWQSANVGVFAKDMTYGSMDYNGWEIMASEKGVYYCVEPEIYMPKKEEAKTGVYDRYQEKDILNNTRLSKTQLAKIELLAYYGYRYPGHEAKKWYGITQVMIWKVVRPDIVWSYKTSRYGNVQEDLYNKEEKELESLINNHSVLPSFANQTMTLAYEKEIILSDQNKVLQQFELSSNKDVAFLSQHELHVSPRTDDAIELSFQKKSLNVPFYFYSSKDYQDVVSRGNISLPMFRTSLIFEDYEIKVWKKDKDRLIGLADVTFELYDEEKKLLAEKKTDLEGILIFSHLKKGTYYLKEKEALAGYQRDLNEYSIVLDNEFSYEMTLFNEKKKGKVQITKIDKTTKQVLSGVTFELYRKGNNEKLQELIIKDEPLTLFLEEGEYFLKEIVAPKGYECSQEMFAFEVKYQQEKVLEIENEIILENPDTKDSIFTWIYLFFLSFSIVTISIFFSKRRA